MASVDDLETNTKFAAEHQADFPILADPEKNVAKAYGVIRTDVPPERQLAQRWSFFIGPDGKIVDIDKKVSAKTAGTDLAARLESLGVRKK
jgi:thioredoxin-dependent peroxiredoxin